MWSEETRERLRIDSTAATHYRLWTTDNNNFEHLKPIQQTDRDNFVTRSHERCSSPAHLPNSVLSSLTSAYCTSINACTFHSAGATAHLFCLPPSGCAASKTGGYFRYCQIEISLYFINQGLVLTNRLITINVWTDTSVCGDCVLGNSSFWCIWCILSVSLLVPDHSCIHHISFLII